jgi:hypothetical protein
VGKLLLGSGGSGLAMTLAGPILSSLFGRPTPPTIQDVLHELDGIKDDLTQMDQHLDAINQQVLVDEAVTEIGDCNIEASELEALRSTVYEIRHLGAIRLERHRLGNPGGALDTYGTVARLLSALT